MSSATEHGPDTTSVRDLNTYLDFIWQQHFSDIPRVNEVEIAYGHPWKQRLGLIRLSLDNKLSFIGINALLRHRFVPECVLIATIAHEVTHYAHGFGSPLPRLYQHPHANSVVDRELEQRGLGEYVRSCDEWIDREWLAFYQMHRKTSLLSPQGCTLRNHSRAKPLTSAGACGILIASSRAVPHHQ